MEKPQLDKVIEKLKQADIREWETFEGSDAHWGPYFELKRYGLVFRVEKRSNGDKLISIENHDKSVHLEYKRPGYKIYHLYNEISDSIRQSQERDANDRLFSLLCEGGIDKTNLETIITRLKELDARAWKPDKFFDKKYPELTAEISGITFSISKGLISGYGLEIKYGKEPDKKFSIDYTKLDKKYAKKLIGEIYEKVYKELKEDKEKEFEENLNNFLSE